MDKLKEVLKPKDVKPSLLKRLEANYGPVDMTNDFFSTDLDTYFKTSNINKETGQLSHDIIQLASFGDSLKRMSDAVKALKILQTTDEANNDQNIKEITRELKDVFNKYRSHLRTNYPDQYDEIKRQLDEMSTTGGGAGAASFSGGTGMQYATPYAFKKKKKKIGEGIGAHLGPGPKASEDGVEDNAYVKQFKYKLVPKNKNGNYVQKGSGLEVKQLFEAESASEFQKKRITAFDQIEQELNNIYKMLSNAKNETVEYYNDNESSYSVVKPTDLVLDYIKDIKDLLK
jgi:seryl-tRNA synthetase